MSLYKTAFVAFPIVSTIARVFFELETLNKSLVFIPRSSQLFITKSPIESSEIVENKSTSFPCLANPAAIFAADPPNCEINLVACSIGVLTGSAYKSRPALPITSIFSWSFFIDKFF